MRKHLQEEWAEVCHREGCKNTLEEEMRSDDSARPLEKGSKLFCLCSKFLQDLITLTSFSIVTNPLYRGLQVACQVAKCKFKVMIAK